MSSTHLDLDALADAVAGSPDPHLAGCADCSSRLAELRAADAQVVATLGALRAPPVPDGLVDRLLATLADEPALEAPAPVAPVLPLRRSLTRRVLPAAAAAVLGLGGLGLGLSTLGGGADDSASTAGSADSAVPLAAGAATTASGTDWADAAAASAVLPAVLDGTAGSAGGAFAAESAPEAESLASTDPATTTRSDAAADPLARLRTPEGLADCLAGLVPPEDPGQQPLALDYATYAGGPALAVVLPDPDPAQLAVFVVGPSCTRGAEDLLLFRRLARP